MSSSGSNNAFNTPNAPIACTASSRRDAQWDQVLDDADHKRVSEGNKEVLLQERLECLRGLKDVIEADDWKYAKQNPKYNATRTD